MGNCHKLFAAMLLLKVAYMYVSPRFVFTGLRMCVNQFGFPVITANIISVVLRMPVVAFLADKGSGVYSGIRLSPGQDLFSQRLVLDSYFAIPQAVAVSSPQSSGDHFPRNSKGKVARGICIAERSLKSDISNLPVICPAR
ncbi:hypothetical protein Ancab_026682 [Ancistrocladus abbreviatus]